VHHCPEEALSDGQQSLRPEQYAQLAGQIRDLVTLFDKKISPVGEASQ
jgi:3-deoxy-D-arabino-heptulosonate 7-phosphate (DAHP) synthase